jgi:hypothetical protein
MDHGTLLFMRKNHHSETKTVSLAAIYRKVVYVHFLRQYRMKEKISVELWMAKVPHSIIRSQLKMRRVLAYENDNFFSLIIPRMPVLVR